MKKKRILAIPALAMTAGLLLAGCSADSEAANTGNGSSNENGTSSGIETAKEGTLIVTFGPYMPFTAEEDGKAIGMDGELVTEMADRLGLDIELAVTDFAGMLSGVQTGRSDVAIGTINWKADRTNDGYYTDDTYYNPPAVGGPEGVDYKTVEDLEGKRICTVTGYAYADAIPEIEGAEEALFPRMEDVVEEFAAGRCDAVFLDPLVVSYTAKQRPDIGLKLNYLEAPTEEQVEANPGLVVLQQAVTGFYTANPSIASALSDTLREMYADGWMDELITSYGGDPDAYLEAPKEVWERRIGVDREDGWTPPSEVRNTAL